jgi:hypothetical protein
VPPEPPTGGRFLGFPRNLPIIVAAGGSCQNWDHLDVGLGTLWFKGRRKWPLNAFELSCM